MKGLPHNLSYRVHDTLHQILERYVNRESGKGRQERVKVVETDVVGLTELLATSEAFFTCS